MKITIINPCFIKQTRGLHYFYSFSNVWITESILKIEDSDICVSNSGCCKKHYHSDFESYFFTQNKLQITDNLANISIVFTKRIDYRSRYDYED